MALLWVHFVYTQCEDIVLRMIKSFFWQPTRIKGFSVLLISIEMFLNTHSTLVLLYTCTRHTLVSDTHLHLRHTSNFFQKSLKSSKISKFSVNPIHIFSHIIWTRKYGQLCWPIFSPFGRVWEKIEVGNICFLSPLILSKWEDLAFSVCIKVCLFFNFWMLKCTIMANKT